jgi:hypothetical protein
MDGGVFSSVIAALLKLVDFLQAKQDRRFQTQAVLAFTPVEGMLHRWRIVNQGGIPAEFERVELVFRRLGISKNFHFLST